MSNYNSYYYEKKLNNLAKRKAQKLAEAEYIIKKYGSNLMFNEELLRKVKYLKSSKFSISCDLNVTELIHEIESNGFKVVFDKDTDSYTVTRKENVSC